MSENAVQYDTIGVSVGGNEVSGSAADVVKAAVLYTVIGVGIYTITKKAVETVYAAKKFRKSNKK